MIEVVNFMCILPQLKKLIDKKKVFFKLQPENHTHFNKTAFKIWTEIHLDFQKHMHCYRHYLLPSFLLREN